MKEQNDLPKFPLPHIVPDSIVETRIWIFENGDFHTEEDLSALLSIMYDHPEDNIFLYTPKGESIAPLVGAALEASTIVVVESQGHYYPHPKVPRNYVQIREATARDWEREVLAQQEMYFRSEIKLSERACREFEMQQLIEMQKVANSNPIKLEPNFMGIGIDLRKTFTWLKQRLRR